MGKAVQGRELNSRAQTGAANPAPLTWLCRVQDLTSHGAGEMTSSPSGGSGNSAGVPAVLTLRSASHPLTFGFKFVFYPFLKFIP